jgi:pilus assembly protein FimV
LRWAFITVFRGNDLMSGPSKLSLAIALALIGGNAFALGLGSIQVKSGLNQPLNAEITVTADSPAEANGLIVGLASAEDFTRVGLNRTRISVPIDFAVSTNGRGQSVIKLTTKDIVREPFLDLLVEVNWPNGKLLREYTVLLDPPVTAPVRGSTATVAPAKEAAAAPAQKLAAEKQPKPRPTAVKPPRTVAAASKPAPAPKAPAPAPSAAPKQHVAAAGDYGPVAEGETLSEVARATKPDDSTNVNQMMLALLKDNPNAFYKDNINALKRGAILRIPSGDEIKATGSSMAAAAAVREQNSSWSGNAAVAKPTVVANAGAPKSSTPPKPEKVAAAKPSEHLALVPPRAGKDSQTTADHPGPSTGTGTNAETKAELTRTKEALASREQEATELRSRVKQLEDLNGKDQRLLSLKESEIADLQNKLKQLQAGKPATAATTTPAPTAVVAKPPEATATPTTKPADTGTKTEPKLTAQDIWGDISANGKSPAAKPTTTPAATTPPTTTPAIASTTTPATTPAAATPNATPPASGSPTAASTPSTPPKTDVTPPATTPSSTTPSTTTPATSSVTTSPVTTPVTSAPVSITNPPATTPVKPATPAVTPKPIAPPEQPWYQNNTALLAGGAGLLLIGLLALMRFMRKPKPVLMPVGPDEADIHAVSSEDEHHLLDALAQHPGDPHLSLELLSLYYAQHDAAKFEAAAEAMYAHIADPTQPEWQQVRAMGEQLCPHNPLFSGSDHFAGTTTHAHDDHAGFGHLADTHAHEDEFDLGTHSDAKPSVEDNFDFDLTDHAAAGTVIPAHEMDFSQQTIVGHPTPPPPPAFQAPPARAVPAPAPAPVAAKPAPVAAKPAEDFFAGEDAIGTKLDLAKAYLDMGDPEGARSMLDEVMAEGNDTQKGEARKLLAEIR